MFNYEKDRAYKLDQILFTIRISSLFFSAIAYFQFFFKGYETNFLDKQYHIFMLIIVLSVIIMVYFLWMFLYKMERKSNKIIFKILQPVIFIIFFTGAIMATGGYASNFKYLFLFLVLSYTIEWGTDGGLTIAGISSVIILGIDLLYPLKSEVNYYFENDTLLVGLCLIIAWTIGFYVKIEQNHILTLTELVNKDELTGLYNHRYFYEYIEMIFKRCKEKNETFSLILFDIDYFKDYNDTFGHQKGDKLLKQLAKLVNENITNEDKAFRYGGDEFTIILRNINEKDAYDIAEKLRQIVEDFYFEGQEHLNSENMTISVGISSFSNKAKTHIDVIKYADEALYRAKFFRKNIVARYVSILDELQEYEKSDNDKTNSIAYIKTLVGIINSRDKVTYTHVERVVFYCKIVGEKFDLDEESKSNLIYGAYMHDVGKINVPTEVLIKTEKLTNDEWNTLKQHPIDGVEIIKNIDVLNGVAPLVLQHHERYDGYGYPNGLKGNDILYLARILTVVDSFDAMTSSRPYNKKMKFSEAFDELRRCSGTQFDPEIVEKFISVIENTKQFNIND